MSPDARGGLARGSRLGYEERVQVGGGGIRGLRAAVGLVVFVSATISGGSASAISTRNGDLPVWSPDGTRIAFAAASPSLQILQDPRATLDRNVQVGIMSSVGRPLRRFTVTDRTESVAELQWASSRRLILSEGPDGALLSVDVISGKLAHLGGRGPLSLLGNFTFTISADGARVAYVADSPYQSENNPKSGPPVDPFAIGVVPAAGGAAHLLPQPVHASDAAPSFSPDGENLVVARTLLDPGKPTRPPSLMIQSVSGGTARPLNIRGDQPLWSPNGRWIAYQHLARGASGQLVPWTLNVVSPSGGKPRVLLPSGIDEQLGLSWSPDSTRLAFVTESGDAIGTVTLNGKITIFKLPGGLSLAADLSPATGAPDTPPQWSPDGKTLLFAATSKARWYETAIYAIDAAGHHLHRIG